MGLTGATYASGTRGMPGGSAFTLTGVFIDRITPRLMAVGAVARSQSAQLNAMGGKLGRMTAYLERHNVALDRSRSKIKQLAAARLQLKRAIDTQNSSMARGIRLATQEEQARLKANRTAVLANQREIVSIDAKIKKIQQSAIMYELEGRAAAKGGMGGRTDVLLGRAARDDVRLQTYRVSKQKAVGRGAALAHREGAYITALKAEGVVLDGNNRKELVRLGLNEAQLKKLEERIALEVGEARLLQIAVRTQEKRLILETTITNELRRQVGLAGGAGAVGKKGLMMGAGLGIGAAAVSGIAPIVAAGTMMEYEQSLARIGAIGQFSRAEKWGMGKYTTGLSQQYALSPEQMLGGSLVGVKAGYRDIAELQGMLVPSMQLAIVNGEELDNVMEQLIMTMNAFHIETSQANQVIANQQALINNSLLQFGDYTDGMKYAAAWANKLGLTYKEVGSMIATMTDAGVRAGISGRSLRRMFSKFAADMDVIAEKLEQGGSELDVFTEDGVLNIRKLIDFLGNGVDNVEDMQFALERFGLRGAQSFLLLAQNMDKYDNLLSIQSGNTEELAKMAAEAQDTISGQWQLLKNMLREPLLTESLITEMKDLIIFMKDEGGLRGLAQVFADIVRNSISWLKGGGLSDLLKIVKSLADTFVAWQPALLFIANIMTKIAKMWWLVLPLARMAKANTLLNIMARTLLQIAVYRQMGGYGPKTAFFGRNVLGMAGTNMIAKPAAGAAVAGAGVKTAAAGGLGLGAGLAIAGGATIALLTLYALWKRGRDKQEENIKDLLSGQTSNNYNFYGDTYGMDEFNNRIQGANTDAWSANDRLF